MKTDRRKFVAAWQAAADLGISERTLSAYRIKGIGPPFALAGRRVLYHHQHIDEWKATGACQTHIVGCSNEPVSLQLARKKERYDRSQQEYDERHPPTPLLIWFDLQDTSGWTKNTRGRVRRAIRYCDLRYDLDHWKGMSAHDIKVCIGCNLGMKSAKMLKALLMKSG